MGARAARSVPHIVIVDECGCRRGTAAAFVLEAWLETVGVLAVVDWGPSAFWQSFIPCQVRRLHLCMLVAMSTLASTHTRALRVRAHTGCIHRHADARMQRCGSDCRSSSAAKPVVRGGR